MYPDPVYAKLNVVVLLMGMATLVVIAYLWHNYRIQRINLQREIGKDLKPLFEIYKDAILSDGWVFVDLITIEDVRRIAIGQGVGALTTLDELHIVRIIRSNFNKHEGLSEATIRAAIKQWIDEKTVNHQNAAQQGGFPEFGGSGATGSPQQ